MTQIIMIYADFFEICVIKICGYPLNLRHLRAKKSEI